MPEFTAEYEALMRELAIEHEFRPGDWALVVITISGDRTERWLLNGEALRVVPKVEPKYEGPGKPPIFWLPTGDDWDRKLLEAGVCRRLYVTRLVDGRYRAGTDEVGPHVDASSILEAKARLWMALTGRKTRG